MTNKAHHLLHEIERITLQIDMWQGYLEWLKAELKKEVDSNRKVIE